MKKLTLLIMAIVAFGAVIAQELPDNWTVASSDITIVEETTTVNDGTSAMAVTFTSQSNQDIESGIFNVTADSVFSYKLDVYDNDIAGRVRMAIIWDTENQYSSIYSEDMDSWQTLELTDTVPEGATTAFIRLRFYDINSNWDGDASMIIDNAIYSEDDGVTNLIANPSFENWSAPAPALTIGYPSDGATINTADVDVTFSVENFVLGTDGKVRYNVDATSDVFVTTADPISLTSLTEASHTVEMELVDMADASLATPVTASVTFTVDLAAAGYTTIYDIQYTEAADGNSPSMDQTETTKGVVTAVSGTNFWIQDGAGSWNGLYVYTTITPTPAIGDSVMVTGTIAEYYNLTEVSPTTDVTILNSGNTVAAPADLTTMAVNAEEYEGVLVTVTGVCTNAVPDNGMIELNDGSGVVKVKNAIYSELAVIAGNSYTVVGVVDYGYDEFKILPRDAADVTDLGASSEPMLSITSPEADETLYSTDISATFDVSNFVLGTDGKVAWNLDGAANAYVTESPIAITGLANGTYTLNLELVDMSDAPLATPVTASVSFTIDLSGPTYTNISDIQNGSVTGNVWIKAVVSASFNEAEFGEGYYLQQGGGAWNGIFVEDLTKTPSIGDSVVIAGTINESYDFTQIESVTSYSVIGIDGIVAAPVEVSTLDAASEQYESVLVKVTNAQCDTLQSQYGEWWVNDGSGPLQCKDVNAFDFTEELGTSYNITGVMSYGYGDFSINYRRPTDITIVSGIENELAANVSIYPNPASDIVNIATDGANTIKVTNLVGQIVEEVSVDNAIETINISNYNTGVYFVEITKANETTVVKLVVE